VTLATQTVTAEEFATWPDEPGLRFELIRGEVESLPMPGGVHAAIAAEITGMLGNFVKPRRLGRVFTEVGFVLSTDPDHVRGPDVAYMSHARLSRVGDAQRFLRVPPELVVEVVSPHDRPGAAADKIAEWLAFGVDVVWQVHPLTRTVRVHRAGAEPVTLRPDDPLDGGDVLPGFVCRPNELFE